MESDPLVPRLDKKAIAIGVLIAVVLALLIWWIRSRHIPRQVAPSTPMLPQSHDGKGGSAQLVVFREA